MKQITKRRKRLLLKNSRKTHLHRPTLHLGRMVLHCTILYCIILHCTVLYYAV
jgi:hypothetical protein